MDLQFTPLAEPWKPYKYPDGTRSPSVITDGVVYRCAHCNAHWDDPSSIPAGHGVEKKQLVLRPWKRVPLQNGWPSPCLITDGAKHWCVVCGDEYKDPESIPEVHRRNWPEVGYVPLASPWKWHKWSWGAGDKLAPTWVTNGVTWRCLRCGKEFSQTRSIPGHEASVHSPEDRKSRQLLTVDALLSRIDEGRWSTFGDVAAIASLIGLRESELKQYLTSLTVALVPVGYSRKAAFPARPDSGKRSKRKGYRSRNLGMPTHNGM